MVEQTLNNPTTQDGIRNAYFYPVIKKIHSHKLIIMNGQHHYKVFTEWTGNKGTGTANYRAYERSHIISVEGKAAIAGSSDPAFRGDKTKHNPEELLVAALSTCHMLSYLHVCAAAGIIVTDYVDEATGTMEETPNGGGHFTEVTLNPIITVSNFSMIEQATELHKRASELCFIAASVNFPVHHKPVCKVVGLTRS